MAGSFKRKLPAEESLFPIEGTSLPQDGLVSVAPVVGDSTSERNEGPLCDAPPVGVESASRAGAALTGGKTPPVLNGLCMIPPTALKLEVEALQLKWIT